MVSNIKREKPQRHSSIYTRGHREHTTSPRTHNVTENIQRSQDDVNDKSGPSFGLIMYIFTTLEFPTHNANFHLLTTSVNAKYYY